MDWREEALKQARNIGGSADWREAALKQARGETAEKSYAQELLESQRAKLRKAGEEAASSVNTGEVSSVQKKQAELYNRLNALANKDKSSNIAQDILVSENPLAGINRAVGQAMNVLRAGAQQRLDEQEAARKKAEEIYSQAVTPEEKYRARMAAVEQSMRRAPTNLTDPLTAMLPEWIPEEDPLERQAVAAEKRYQESNPNLLTDVAKGAVGLVSDAAISGATGVPYLAVMAGQGGAQAAQNALDEKGNANKALIAGLGSGAISAGIESAFGIAGKWGAPILNKIGASKAGQKILSALPQKALDFIASLPQSKLGQIAGNALGEGIEEIAEYDLQRIFENLILDKDTPRDVKEQLYSGLIGAGIGGLFGAGSNIVSNRLAGRAENQPVSEANATEEITPVVAETTAEEEIKPAETNLDAKTIEAIEKDEISRNIMVGLYGEEWKNKASEAIGRRTLEKAEEMRDMRNSLDEVARRSESTRLVDAMKKRGINVETKAFAGEDSGRVGYYDVANDRIVLNERAKADEVFKFVTAHEISHSVENTDAYSSLRSLAEKSYTPEGLEQAIKKTQAEYRREVGQELDREGALREIAADYLGNILKDSKRLEQIVYDDRNLAERLLDAIKKFLSDVSDSFKGIDRSELENAERILEKALAEKTGTDSRGRSVETKKASTTGEGVQHSINTMFGYDVDAWDGKSDKTFNVGRTSEPLKSIGIEDRVIIWRSRKMGEIIKKHPQMTREIIKQVPNILEDPILILKSKQSESRIALFGEVKDTEGNPVLAILELQPTDKGGELLDLNVIASAYGKDSNPAKFIETSDLLYISKDKKRTADWMQGLGLQSPSDTTNRGSIGSITYQDGKVKVVGVPYAQYMQGAVGKSETPAKSQEKNSQLEELGVTQTKESVDTNKTQDVKSKIKTRYSIVKVDSEVAKWLDTFEKRYDADEIWRKQLAMRDAAGNWVTEVDDSGAKFYRDGKAKYNKNPDVKRYRELYDEMYNGYPTPEEFKELRLLEGVVRAIPRGETLEHYLEHPKLYEKYPEARDVKVVLSDNMGENHKGSYTPSTNTITLSTQAEDPLKTVLHEVQHWLQYKEGRPRGASQNVGLYAAVKDALTAMADDKSFKSLSAEEKAERIISHIEGEHRTLDAAARYYYRNASGEVEARSTASRLVMDEEARGKYKPKIEGTWLNSKNFDAEFEEAVRKAGISESEQDKITQMIWGKYNGKTDWNAEEVRGTLRGGVGSGLRGRDGRKYSLERFDSADIGEVDSAGKRLTNAMSEAETETKDAEYLSAVERGDMETTQKMVDEAAKVAGYTVKAWHGTPNEGFSVFDSKKIGSTTDEGIFGSGFYFTTNRGTADGYATASGKTMPVYLSVNKAWWAIAHRNIREAAEELGMDESALMLREYGGRGKIVAPILSQTRQFAAHLQEHGYGSVIVQHGKNDYEIVVFDSNAIKSADPVTYDDDGNVIPLSERFNPQNKDIRYSLTRIGDAEVDSTGRRLTEEQREYFKDSKVRDENGNLQVMYHGTMNGGFNVFGVGGAYYFTNDKKYANTFAGLKDDGTLYERVKNANGVRSEVYEVYLDVKNPYVYEENEDNHVIDGVDFWDIGSLSSNEKIYSVAKAHGYDALVFEDLSQVVVFSPEQIKRIDNTKPTSDPDIRYALTKRDEADIEKIIDELAKEFGIMRPGANRTTDVKTPKATGQGNVRRFAQSVMESQHSDDEIRTLVKEGIIDNVLTYKVEGDQAALDYANNELEKLGYERAMGAWENAISGDKALSKNEIVFGERLLVEAAKNQNYEDVLKLTAQIAVEGTRAGQMVQALSMLKRMGPEGQLVTLQRYVEKTNKDFAQEARKKAAKNKGDILRKEQELRKEREKAKGQEEALKKSMEEAKKSASEMKKSLSKTLSGNKSLEKRIAKVQERITELEGKIADSKEINEELKEQLAELREERNKLYKLANSYKNKNATKERQIFDKANQILDLEKILTRQVKMYETQKAALENLSMTAKAMKELERGIASLKGEIVISEETVKDIMGQTTQKGLDEAMERAYKEVAAQVPATLLDKWNAWRYMAMLTNPTTHIRNVFGNAAFMPARALKNAAKVYLEEKLDVKEKTSAYLGKDSEDYLKLAGEAFEENKNFLKSGGKYNPSNVIMENRRIFDTEWLEAIRKGNSAIMEAEDMIFLKKAYVEAYARYLKANNFLKSSNQNDLKQKANEWATREALRATYRDASDFANMLSKYEREHKFAGFIVNAFVPFKKTPINIAKRGFEYSPAGLIKGIWEMTSGVKSGSISAAVALDDLASGLSGTAIMALGMLLAHMGLLTGSGDDDKEKNAYDKAVGGFQPYSLIIGDTTYTLNWAAPTALPMFTGVEFYNIIEKEGLSFGEMLGSLFKVLDPMAEMSMLSSLVNIIRSAGYESDFASMAGNMAMETVTSYLGQAVPTLGRRIAGIVDDTQRNVYYRDETKGMPTAFVIFGNEIKNKIPLISKTIEPKIDVWGRTIQDGTTERILENLVSPGYFSKKKITPVDEEIIRVYENTADASVIPDTSPGETYSSNGENVYMNATEFTTYRQIAGQMQYNNINSLIKTKWYKGLTDEEKAEAISEMYNYANYFGKKQVFGENFTSDKLLKKYKTSLNAKVPYSDIYRYDKEIDELTKKRGDKAAWEVVVEYLNRQPLNKVQKMYLFPLFSSKKENPYA